MATPALPRRAWEEATGMGPVGCTKPTGRLSHEGLLCSGSVRLRGHAVWGVCYTHTCRERGRHGFHSPRACREVTPQTGIRGVTAVKAGQRTTSLNLGQERPPGTGGVESCRARQAEQDEGGAGGAQLPGPAGSLGTSLQPPSGDGSRKPRKGRLPSEQSSAPGSVEFHGDTLMKG